MTEPSKAAPPDKLEQMKYFVAYLEFDDAVEWIKKPKKSDELLQKIYRVYEKTLGAFDEYNRIDNRKSSSIKFLIFSNNIILAEECSSSICAEISSIVDFCSMFQVMAMREGVTVRGAISCGKLYIDTIFVYGEALVKTYVMESKEIYPRIIVDTQVFEMSNSAHDVLFIETSLRKSIKKDLDGKWFVNFFAPIVRYREAHEEESLGFIKSIRKLIVAHFEKINAHIPNKDSQKYSWLAKTFNTLCDEFKYSEQKLPLDSDGEPASSKLYDGPGRQRLK